MGVAEARHLLGFETPGQRRLDVDDRHLVGIGREDVGIHIRLRARRGHREGLIKIPADEDQAARTVDRFIDRFRALLPASPRQRLLGGQSRKHLQIVGQPQL